MPSALPSTRFHQDKSNRASRTAKSGWPRALTCCRVSCCPWCGLTDSKKGFVGCTGEAWTSPTQPDFPVDPFFKGWS
jgi:hypothetical protein